MQKIDEMQARCDAATEGPWAVEFAGDFGDQSAVILCSRWRGSDSMLNTVGFGEDVDTARFVASARTDMPRLIAALRAVSAEHAPESLDLLHPDCAEGACDHDPDDPENPSDCPVVKTTVCAGCLDLAQRAWRFYGEEGVEAVEYPCPTIKAIAKALEVEA